MISGERIASRIQEYATTATELHIRKQIYSSMVVYGLLTYDDSTGTVYIPNKELMDKFNELLLSKESLGYVYRLAKESEKMLKVVLSADTETMTEILKYAHDTESPILSYNSEIELSAVVNLVYLAARDRYRVEQEDKAGEGRLYFYLERSDMHGIILELKIDSSAEEAVQQIKEKHYMLRFEGKLGEKRNTWEESWLQGSAITGRRKSIPAGWNGYSDRGSESVLGVLLRRTRSEPADTRSCSHRGAGSSGQVLTIQSCTAKISCYSKSNYKMGEIQWESMPIREIPHSGKH